MWVKTPLGAALAGIVAGLAATLLLSVLARVMPGMQIRPKGAKQDEGKEKNTSHSMDALTPANVLIQPQSPGPEGLAQQFAFKVGSGLFGRDITPHERFAGFLVHIVYGSLWGFLFGLIQATFHWIPVLFGAIYGLVVWLVGPAFLVPAMKILHPPTQEPPLRTIMMALGHILYGIAVALVFAFLEKKVA